MLLIDFKKHFFEALSVTYPESEIHSFFYILMKYKLRVSRVDLALNQTVLLKDSEVIFFKKSLEQLKKEVPIQYIIGETEFYGLTFKVNKHVLIPRPETEELVNWIINDTSKTKPVSILDIGTGSGCIAISLAKNLPNSKVTAIDISENAIKIATQNAKLSNVEINFLKVNILNINKLPENFDIIVSNPPYVRELEKQKMQQNVIAYEPHIALFVKNENPLIFYEKIASLAVKNLSLNGQLYFEINQYLGIETINLLALKNFKKIELRKDFFDVDRMIKASG